MTEPPNIQFVGSPCGHHGPYTFYKAFKYSRYGKYRQLSLGEFFFIKIAEDVPLGIGELQLLWEDKNTDCPHLASVRLYFLPEHTPEGKQEYHGEDEVLAENNKVVMRLEDLLDWVVEEARWEAGSKAIAWCDLKLTHKPGVKVKNGKQIKMNNVKENNKVTNHAKHVNNSHNLRNDKCTKNGSDGPGNHKNNMAHQKENGGHDEVIVLSFPQYCRYRSVLKRLENMTDTWLKSALVSAIGGFTVYNPNTRILFCRDTIEHPLLEEHEWRLDHLAPNLKGRPRKKRVKLKHFSMESDSNESEYGGSDKMTPEKQPQLQQNHFSVKMGNKSPVRRNNRNLICTKKQPATLDEKKFLSTLAEYLKMKGTKIGKIPSLGFKQLDLYQMYALAQKLGGYEEITEKRLWKIIYDKLGGNPGSTSAATCTRRHYEKLLLPFERFMRDETHKPLPKPYVRVRKRPQNGESSDRSLNGEDDGYSDGDDESSQDADESSSDKAEPEKKDPPKPVKVEPIVIKKEATPLREQVVQQNGNMAITEGMMKLPLPEQVMSVSQASRPPPPMEGRPSDTNFLLQGGEKRDSPHMNLTNHLSKSQLESERSGSSPQVARQPAGLPRLPFNALPPHGHPLLPGSMLAGSPYLPQSVTMALQAAQAAAMKAAQQQQQQIQAKAAERTSSEAARSHINRASVIQHTPGSGGKDAGMADQKGYPSRLLPPFVFPGQAPLPPPQQQQPPLQNQVAHKRTYPFSNASGLPPAAHSSRTPTGQLLRDFDPKRPRLIIAEGSILHQHRLALQRQANAAKEDAPTDLSVKRPAMHSSQLPGPRPSSSGSMTSAQAAINLVIPRHSGTSPRPSTGLRQSSPSPHQPPAAHSRVPYTSPSSSRGVHPGADSLHRRSTAPLLPPTLNPIFAGGSSRLLSPMLGLLPRGIPTSPLHTPHKGLLPTPSRLDKPLPQASPVNDKPSGSAAATPSSLRSSRDSPAHVPSSSVGSSAATVPLQAAAAAANAVTASRALALGSPDGHLLLHPAFPQFSPVLPSGLLASQVDPRILYEAHKRASSSTPSQSEASKESSREAIPTTANPVFQFSPSLYLPRK